MNRKQFEPVEKEETQPTANFRSDLFQQALAASLPVPTKSAGQVTLPNEDQRGWLSRFFGGAEDRKHEEVQKVIRNVTGEVVLAHNGMGIIANDSFSVAMETEWAFQETLVQYKDCELAMSTAAGYVQMARGIFSDGMTQITQAGVQHIKNKIANR